ncbi:MAG: ABC transporter transmembrane domain-containing protein [Actinomycetota bacterium]
MKRFFTYLLSGSAYIAGIGLTISSAWLITTASFQPPLQALSIAIVGVRFFGISRSVARYSERVVSHTTVFNQLTGVRVKLFQGISANPLELIRDSGAGRLVKRLVDDVERAQEYELRVTMPHAAATISLATGVALGGWIQPVSLIITVPVAFLLLFVIPRLIKSHSQGIASSIENLESSYATQIQEATHGLIEAKLYGYLDQRLARISTLEMQALEEERKLNTSNRTFQGVLLVAIGFTLFALTEMALHFSRHIPPVQVTILIFLPLVAFEATLALYPNLFSAGKMVLARQEIAAIQSSKQSEVKPLHMLNEKSLSLMFNLYRFSGAMKAQSFAPSTSHCVLASQSLFAVEVELANQLLLLGY